MNADNEGQPKKVGLRATPLHKLKRTGNVLASPAKSFKLNFSSWINEAFPEVLWSALLFSQLPRLDALQHIRELASKISQNRQDFGDTVFIHSEFAKLPNERMLKLFDGLLQKESAKQALAPMLALEGLPDRGFWAAHLMPLAEDEAWSRLAFTVAEVFDHQSEMATDCRWSKVILNHAKGKMHYAPHLQEKLREIEDYPNRGELTKVRPSVRASEMMLRPGQPFYPSSTWPTEFWDELWRRTACEPINPDEPSSDVNLKELFNYVAGTYEAVVEHFVHSNATTGIDARHDAAFGIVLFILQMFLLTIRTDVGGTIAGRPLLRVAVEAVITLLFLAKKDDATIWLQYRNYGAGQSKLAFLKFDDTDPPAFVKKELLEGLANEDMWQEFLDIKLGAWADKNLRRMAEEADAKALYDKYYDFLSGYAHGNWSAVQHSVFGLCGNPLHRFHRVPLPPRFLTESVLGDFVKLSNRALDALGHLYPPFKPRIKLPDSSPAV